MGSHIIFNDTLQITTEQGFPAELILEKHIQKPFVAENFAGRVFRFAKPELRFYHPTPTRVFLTHNIGGKWLHWGHALIIEQIMEPEKNQTTGKFVIVKIYDPAYQKQATLNETPAGLSFFPL